MRTLTPILEGLGYDSFGNAPHLLNEHDRGVIEEGAYFRASGDMACSVCGQPYRLHPPVQGALWLTRGCERNGQLLVKL